MLTTERKLNQFIIGESSDKGRSRTHNEDSSVIFEAMATAESGQTIPLTVAVVADGIGGNVAGGKASSLAAAEIEAALTEDATLAVTERLLKAVRRANARVYQSSIQDEALQGMGTTVVVAAIADDQLHLVHAGDSRAYLIRANKIYQLTKDHTWAQDALDSGRLTPEQAAKHPNRHVIKRYLGVAQGLIPDLEILLPSLYWGEGEESPPPTVESLTLEEEDVILLCSDGLTDVVDDATIQEVVDHNPAQFATEKLVDLANEEGGPDNITVAILAWRKKEPAAIVPKQATLAPSEVQAVAAESAEAASIGKSIFSPLGLVAALLVIGFLSISTYGLMNLRSVQPKSINEDAAVAISIEPTTEENLSTEIVPGSVTDTSPPAPTQTIPPTSLTPIPTSTLDQSTATAQPPTSIPEPTPTPTLAEVSQGAIVPPTIAPVSDQEIDNAPPAPVEQSNQVEPTSESAETTASLPTITSAPTTVVSVQTAPTNTNTQPVLAVTTTPDSSPDLSQRTVVEEAVVESLTIKIGDVELIVPDNKANGGQNKNGQQFCWRSSSGFTLEQDQLYELIFWLEGQDPDQNKDVAFGLVGSDKETCKNVTSNLAKDGGLPMNTLVNWGVRLVVEVQQEVYQPQSLLSESRKFQFNEGRGCGEAICERD